MLKAFISDLAKRPRSAGVYNQYRDPEIVENLRVYLGYLLEHRSSLLLVGEAPGYKGCRLTGIPFTSGNIIKTSLHPFFLQCRTRLVLKQVLSEATAKIMWEFLGEDKPLPILWNAFPFHPFSPGCPASNRKPKPEEIHEGLSFLRPLEEIFTPSCLAGVGCVGEACLRQAYPGRDIANARHPSYGGKREFQQGMAQLLARACA
jgi:uracil-DNA glycosylase